MSYTVQNMVDQLNEVLIRKFNNLPESNDLTEDWCYCRHIIIELDRLGVCADQYGKVKDKLKDEYPEREII